MNTKIKRKIPYIWLGPIIVLAAMLIWYALGGIYPFGNNSSATIDGISQSMVFLSELSTKIKSGSSLLFSWHIGGGVNFWTIIAYYLANPLNLISLLFKPENMDRAFSVIVLLIPPIQALTFGIYLKNTYKKNDISLVIFSVLWSLGAFSLTSINFAEIWSNALIWFPLVVMGLHKMMEGKSAWQYALFLGLTIASNFYIGWMVCIFCVLYFIYLFIADDDVVYEGVTGSADTDETDDSNEDGVNIFKMLSNSYLLGSMMRFGLSSLLAGGISSVLILPIVKVISETGKGTIENDTFNITADGIWGILASFVNPVGTNLSGILSKDCIFVYAGIAVLILCVSYFFNKGISTRKKVGTFLLIAVFVLSVVFHLPYFIWHGFGEPMGIIFRFVFLWSFVMLKSAYEAFINIEKSTTFGIVAGTAFAGLCTASIYLSDFFGEVVSSKTVTVIVTVAFIVAYTVLLFIISKKTNLKKVLSLVLLVCVVCELFSLNRDNITHTDLTKTLNEYSGVKQFLDRGEKYDRFTFSTNVNDFNDILMYGGLFGFNGYESYSSVADFHYTLTLSSLGTYGNGLNLQNGGREQPPVFNMLFPAKYYIDATGHLTESKYRKLLDENNGYRLFENNYTTPFMFTVSNKICTWEPFAYPINIDNLNEVVKCITDTQESVAVYNNPQNIEYENCKHISYADRVEANKELLGQTEDDGHDHSDAANSVMEYYKWLENRMSGYSYQIEDMTKDAYVTFESVSECDGIMYLFLDTTEFTDLTVEINGRKIDVFAFGKTNNTNYELGPVKKGDVAKIRIGGHRDLNYKNGNIYGIQNGYFTTISYTVDTDKLDKAYEKLDGMSDTQILEFKDTYVKAKVTSYEDGLLYMPITYDEGWTVKIDGKEVPLYEHESHILMTGITKGEHTVEMKYCPQGFVAGVAVTLVSVAILIAWAVISKKRENAYEAENNVNEE